LIGSGRIGDVRLRGQTIWQMAPENRLKTAEISAYWSASDKADWEGAIGYDGEFRRGRARISHIRRFESVARSRFPRRGTDGSSRWASTSTFRSIHSRGGIKLSSQRLAANGSVEARVYRDLNDNGARDAAEPWEAGASITTGRRVSEEATDKDGKVRIGGLLPFPGRCGRIDTESLSDPSLAPKESIAGRRSAAWGHHSAGNRAGRRRRQSKAYWSRTTGRVSKAGCRTGRCDRQGGHNGAKRFRRLHSIRKGRLRPLQRFRLATDSANAAGVERAIDKSAEISPKNRCAAGHDPNPKAEPDCVGRARRVSAGSLH
jgi:hypothetical protein